jgi:hypothetical protein
MADPEYSIITTFSTAAELVEYLKEYGDFLISREASRQKQLNQPNQSTPPQKPDRPENDKRGQHTKLYHMMAREFHQDNPDTPYRECYKMMSKRDKQNTA